MSRWKVSDTEFLHFTPFFLNNKLLKFIFLTAKVILKTIQQKTKLEYFNIDLISEAEADSYSPFSTKSFPEH